MTHPRQGRLGHGGPGSLGLGPRLLASHVLVLLAGGVTFLIVSLVVGPGIFDAQARAALGSVTPPLARHLVKAFVQATVTSLVLAGLVASLTAISLSRFATRRITRPVRELAAAAVDVAGGSYEMRIAPPRLGGEFAVLAEALNMLGCSLDQVERTRGRLLNDLAHELRTPLATLGAYIESLEDGVVEPGPETWSTMRERLDRLQRLVDDVALVSRAEERQVDLHMRPTRPSDLVDSALRSVEAAYRAKGVHLSSRNETRLPQLDVDPDRIAEVLGNLLSNALRHTPPGGHVELAATAAGHSVHLSVTDDGEGMVPEHLAQVFERFYRADASRSSAVGGSGIGLTIVRALVHGHGGSVRAFSSGPGTGSTFVVELPAGQPALRAFTAFESGSKPL